MRFWPGNCKGVTIDQALAICMEFTTSMKLYVILVFSEIHKTLTYCLIFSKTYPNILKNSDISISCEIADPSIHIKMTISFHKWLTKFLSKPKTSSQLFKVSSTKSSRFKLLSHKCPNFEEDQWLNTAHQTTSSILQSWEKRQTSFELHRDQEKQVWKQGHAVGPFHYPENTLKYPSPHG